MANFLTRIFGSRNQRLLRQYAKTVKRINGLEPDLEVRMPDADALPAPPRPGEGSEVPGDGRARRRPVPMRTPAGSGTVWIACALCLGLATGCGTPDGVSGTTSSAGSGTVTGAVWGSGSTEKKAIPVTGGSRPTAVVIR